MAESDSSNPTRRSFVVSAALGLGGLAAAAAPEPEVQAQAPEPPARPRFLRVPVWSAEYTATKKQGSVALAMYRKRLGRPQPAEAPPGVLILVHGSSISARPSFDLSAPGLGDYSMMNRFAEWGYDVWTLDHEGYGRSSRTEGNSDIASGVEDLKAAVDVIERETGQTSYHLFGVSSGALRAGAFAMARPRQVDRLVLEAFTWTGKGSPTLEERKKQLDSYRASNRRPRGRDMIRSIFTRDRPGSTPPPVAEAMADAELQFGDSVPTGTYLDMSANLPVVDPARVTSPVLIVRGEHDGIATEDDLLDFYKRLPNPDRQFVMLANTGHGAGFGPSRNQLWHAMRAFLELPARLTS